MFKTEIRFVSHADRKMKIMAITKMEPSDLCFARRNTGVNNSRSA